MENLYRPTSKTFLKVAGGKMHTPPPTPLDLPLAINYSNYQKSTGTNYQKRAWHNAPPPKYPPAVANIVFIANPLYVFVYFAQRNKSVLFGSNGTTSKLDGLFSTQYFKAKRQAGSYWSYKYQF